MLRLTLEISAPKIGDERTAVRDLIAFLDHYQPEREATIRLVGDSGISETFVANPTHSTSRSNSDEEGL
jgi:hypothetical protein